MRAWAQDPATSGAATGLAHVGALHAALSDLVDLPEAQAALSARGSADRLLDAFLRLADAHVVELKRDVAEALAVVRHHDSMCQASALWSQRKAGKDLACLVASATRDGAAAGSGRPSSLSLVAGLLAEAAAAATVASSALFGTVAAMSASASTGACSCKRTTTRMCFTKKVSEEEKETVALVERLEECIDVLEAGSDKVFRNLVQIGGAAVQQHSREEGPWPGRASQRCARLRGTAATLLFSRCIPAHAPLCSYLREEGPR